MFNSDIVSVYKHWLLPNNLDLIKYWHTDWDSYVASVMNDTENCALKGGRPYDGIGFYGEDLQQLIKS